MIGSLANITQRTASQITENSNKTQITDNGFCSHPQHGAAKRHCPFLYSQTMNYAETIDYLFNVTPVFEHIGAGAYKEGLSNTIALDRHFGHPHRKFKSVHVAGTNGKGSCSHTIAAALQAQGYKVGLYTSPHLVDFRERIRVNGECISEQYVIDFVEQERHFFEPLHPSFFELTTALAFKYFAEQSVDYAVVEVGLGGRLDCTNIITPVLSVITNISFDHTGFLGNTLEQIAGEKAGIIKHGVPVVVGEDNEHTRPVFEQKTLAMQAPITFASDEEQREVISAKMSSQGGIDYTTRHFGTLHGELGGQYQQRNANTVLCALRILNQLGHNVTQESTEQALANVSKLTGLMGRWQTIGTHPLVICDTGHNAGGWQYLAPQIAAQPCAKRRIVFGMVDDKDINAVMTMLPADSVFYFTQATTHRAVPADKVKQVAKAHGLDGDTFTDVPSAYRKALADSSADDFVFVGGSSYVVADLLTWLQGQPKT